eukprot:TRINITY_DN12535_c0_g1_i1.p1 TRINITY_DN12535_c0_g1~~TRINITY_DN12535_c0_g1_i1.p1  ORF type:complete len:426 (-),score=59.48 TRINITY_DN12535_c0_g1_i1:14-1291(-)
MDSKSKKIVEESESSEEENEESFPTETQSEEAQTVTSIAQEQTRAKVEMCFISNESQSCELRRDRHISFIEKSMRGLPSSYSSLDASQPWLAYWAANALHLLKNFTSLQTANEIAEKIASCQCTTIAHEREMSCTISGTNMLGGFGGGPGQLPHLAASYASINALVIAGTEQAYNVVDRQTYYEFLLRLKQPDGSFASHLDGETDIRGTYCALSTARVLNLLTDELVKGTAEWIASCQRYDGGLSGFPGNESHGGYAFCGLAGLCILGRADLLDIQALEHWVCNRQMNFEGGFQGRTNKLVDSCYSFWQGAICPLLHLAHSGGVTRDGTWAYDHEALQRYILDACQDETQGGLRDKPGKSRDLYHTCYSLSGLSLAQHTPAGAAALGGERNLLAELDPVHGVPKSKVEQALQYFSKLPKPQPKAK